MEIPGVGYKEKKLEGLVLEIHKKTDLEISDVKKIDILNMRDIQIISE